MNSPSTNYRYRDLNTFYYLGWQSASESAADADEIIKTPEKHLLSASDLYDSEGGNAGLALQTSAVLLGLGGLMVMNPRMGAYWRTGSLSRFHWADIGITVLGAHWVSQKLGIHLFGDSRKYNTHWAAYGFIKAQNRWQGRQILSKPPMMY